MNRSLALVSIVGGGLALAGCGAGAKQTAHNMTAPSTTIAGVGVATSGPPPKPNTPIACTRRWNGAANARGRAAAKQRAPKARRARVQTATHSGYLSEYAGRCAIFLFTPPKSAAVFVETARGTFRFAADDSGDFAANADFQQNARLRIR